jgi:hypothetical protein
MNIIIQNRTGILALILALLLCCSAVAQQSAQPDLRRLMTYDVSRELSLVGTVVKFDPASSVAPMGAHLLVQTSSGSMDVHLGDGKVLRASHMDLNAGESVRIVGESMALGNGTFFAARIIQKGTQAVAVRNTKGFPLTTASTLSQSQKDALRGVR